MKIKRKTVKAEKPMTKAQEKKLLKKATNKAFSLWGECGRLFADDRCELCGARRGDIKENGKPTILNGHHLRIRDDHSLRFDPHNNSTLCQWCHKFSREGAHRGTILFNEWLRQNRRSDYDYLLKNANGEPIDSLEDVLLAVAQLTFQKYWLLTFQGKIVDDLPHCPRKMDTSSADAIRAEVAARLALDNLRANSGEVWSSETWSKAYN